MRFIHPPKKHIVSLYGLLYPQMGIQFLRYVYFLNRATIKHIFLLCCLIFSQRKKISKIAETIFERSMPSVQKCHRRGCTLNLSCFGTHCSFEFISRLSLRSFQLSLWLNGPTQAKTAQWNLVWVYRNLRMRL